MPAWINWCRRWAPLRPAAACQRDECSAEPFDSTETGSLTTGATDSGASGVTDTCGSATPGLSKTAWSGAATAGVFGSDTVKFLSQVGGFRGHQLDAPGAGTIRRDSPPGAS